MRSHIITALIALGLCAMLGACFSSTKDDTAPTDDTAPDTTGDLLTDTHDGWRDPACWDCHATASTHNSDKNPYECVSCHGSNGAPGGHTTHTPCAECHQQPHAADGFPDPDSCLVCHP